MGAGFHHRTTIARPSYDHRTILDVILAISLVRSSYDHRALGLRRIYEKSNILGSHDHRSIIVRNARWSCDARPNLAIQTHVQIGRVFCTFCPWAAPWARTVLYEHISFIHSSGVAPGTPARMPQSLRPYQRPIIGSSCFFP
jgi:hypothetical protein